MSSSPDSSARRLSEVVAELKETYRAFRGSTAATDRQGTRKRAVTERAWTRLASKLLARGINPRRYVRWAYRRFRERFAIVWVNQIASDNTFSAFLAESAEDLLREHLYVQLQFDTVSRQLQAGRSIREVLDDQLLDVSDTVRYAVARKVGMTDVAARLRRSAELDIENEPLYAELLAGFLD